MYSTDDGNPIATEQVSVPEANAPEIVINDDDANDHEPQVPAVSAAPSPLAPGQVFQSADGQYHMVGDDGKLSPLKPVGINVAPSAPDQEQANPSQNDNNINVAPLENINSASASVSGKDHDDKDNPPAAASPPEAPGSPGESEAPPAYNQYDNNNNNNDSNIYNGINNMSNVSSSGNNNNNINNINNNNINHTSNYSMFNRLGESGYSTNGTTINPNLPAHAANAFFNNGLNSNVNTSDDLRVAMELQAAFDLEAGGANGNNNNNDTGIGEPGVTIPNYYSTPGAPGYNFNNNNAYATPGAYGVNTNTTTTTNTTTPGSSRSRVWSPRKCGEPGPWVPFHFILLGLTCLSLILLIIVYFTINEGMMFFIVCCMVTYFGLALLIVRTGAVGENQAMALFWPAILVVVALIVALVLACAGGGGGGPGGCGGCGGDCDCCKGCGGCGGGGGANVGGFGPCAACYCGSICDPNNDD